MSQAVPRCLHVIADLGVADALKIFEVLSHTITTGKSSSERVIPEGQWAYLAKNPEMS